MRLNFSRMLAGVVVALALALATASAVEAAEVQWFGQAAFKITTPGGKVIMIDPFITKNPKTPAELKDLKKLGKVDLILITHGHGDHVGDAVEISKMTGAKVALNSGLGRTFNALGMRSMKEMIRYNKSGQIKLGDKITVSMVRADHSSEVESKDANGKPVMHPGGDPVGYVIELENGYKIYHAGDTGVFADMAMIADYYKPDLALLPIGGHFTMGPAEAAYAIKTYLKTKTVMPMHYGTFPPLKGTPDELKKALGGFPTTVVVMQPGETRKF